MNVTFARNTTLSSHGVYMTMLKGRRIQPVLVYRSSEPGKELAVEAALNSDLLGRITTAILKNNH